MEIIKELHSVYILNDENKKIAFMLFPFCGDNVVNINHTFVDDSLRGQGVAGKLMASALEVIKENNYKVRLTCSYALSYFSKNPDLNYLLEE